MKKYLFSLIALTMAFIVMAAGEPKISFNATTHDFGTIKEADGEVAYDFVIKNTGTAPLIIAAGAAFAAMVQAATNDIADKSILSFIQVDFIWVRQHLLCAILCGRL